MESHLYEGIQPAEFYDKLENVLATQTNAFKVKIALGYDLTSLTDGDFTQYWHPNLANTYVFNTSVAIHSRFDVLKKIISEIRSIANKLNYPKSGYKLKAITGFKIYITSATDSLTEEVRCFVNDDPKMLLTDMFKYIGDVSVKIQQYNVDKYKSLLQKIINAPGLTGMEIPGVNPGK
ncbi:unnamed protein product [Phytophthora lilii]|uniref:Unnamed protein product n=1 Tax=Phytophthora lilii TaxID=2077276 RepID=A0A9W6WSK0_9STRA|nr:unnamed protein product [Phytophthora lilii]